MQHHTVFHLGISITILITLIFLSSFFALTETALMAVNRYRLRHLVRHNHPAAKRVSLLLERPDRLLGAILLGDTLTNILAASLATIIATHYFGDAGIFVCSLLLALVVLIFGQVAPKTVAALHPQHIALRSSLLLTILLKILYPVVWFVNILSNGLLRIFGINLQKHGIENLSAEELRSIVVETRGSIPLSHQNMLLQIFDLEKVVVEDIMIPRNEIIGIDIADEWQNILDKLTTSQHTRLPVYEDNIDNIKGFLHLRTALNLIAEDDFDKETLTSSMEAAYFIPEGTQLNTQLLNFCHSKRRIGLVVDEYGDIQGLVTLEDLLEEIVGEFTTDLAAVASKDINLQADGSYLIDGTVTLRYLNKTLGWDFPSTGPKTLSGLIIDYLEMIPHANTGLRLNGYPLEILQVKDNIVRTIRIFPQLRKKSDDKATA